jgi:hypothetical protein
MFVASDKHEHLKGLISQGGPLFLQDGLALAEGACAMVAAETLSFSFMQASTCNSMAFLTALAQYRSSSRGPINFLLLKQRHHIQASTCNSMASLPAPT